MSVQENLLPNPGSWPAALFSLAGRARSGAARDVLERLDVRPRDRSGADRVAQRRQPAEGVRRPLAASGARLFVMEEPTAGVDIGAKFAIHALLRDVAAEGAAILVVSSDFEEVATLCDRALVIGRGASRANCRRRPDHGQPARARLAGGSQPPAQVH